MVLLFTATGYIALGVFLLAVWHVLSRSAGGSLLIEYGQAISSKYGSKARKMAAIAFLFSGVALCIMLLSLAFVREADFAASPKSILTLIVVGWLGIVGMVLFLVSWIGWRRDREKY